MLDMNRQPLSSRINRDSPSRSWERKKWVGGLGGHIARPTRCSLTHILVVKQTSYSTLEKVRKYKYSVLFKRWNM